VEHYKFLAGDFDPSKPGKPTKAYKESIEAIIRSLYNIAKVSLNSSRKTIGMLGITFVRYLS
jgi:hypothetical protein